MKVGDKFPVTVANQEVAQAEVKEIGEGTATLIVPATRVVMATKTELTVAPVAAEPAVQTIIDGVDRVSAPETQEVPVAAPVNTEQAPAPVENQVAQTPETPVVVQKPSLAPPADFDAPSSVQNVGVTPSA